MNFDTAGASLRPYLLVRLAGSAPCAISNTEAAERNTLEHARTTEFASNIG